MKGIILAGGSGTRLHPLTLGVTKQLLPVYNKPMIYYPLSVLMLAHIKDILIISTPEDMPLFKRLLGDGSQLGVSFSYAVQEKPNGLAEAFIIGKEFIGKESVCLVLGDNIFYGSHLSELLKSAREKKEGATLFGYDVKDPERYGVVEFDSQGKILSIEEKPKKPKSSIAVTGLYFYDNQVVDIAHGLKPSARGELEITDVNQEYLNRGQASVHVMGRGFTWLDAGTYESLMQASQFVQVIEERQGHCIAALEEIAYNQNFISRNQLKLLGEKLGKSLYGRYLMELAEKGPHHGNH
ncbi:Glucose 1-phosphate thymidyltransferase [Candidatus Protochlamydia naegleriophila]|uniref:Glucose-1-phosphate thymidylyltransferase n=1 Tax=Candidatus Protochlamydia naegleriophila TaxID=389348 RepID=A0A0U5JHG1_9BACT|nr:glucose-1-phosphate thymidylyltransferase RfbA [Candidatus Protochlamydia naegleriophila]CUI17871.1 Glucose 1-phosphate thymidyltransferase [Candidatus Protochlamydia naegleriophila]